MNSILSTRILLDLMQFLNYNDQVKLMINKKLKDILVNYLYLNKEVNFIHDNVFKIIAILTRAYDQLEKYNFTCWYHGHLADGFSTLSTKSGIIIESYYGILISKIITPFGSIKVSGSSSYSSNSTILEYLHSRIKMVEIAPKESSHENGCYGPYYLVTHIDGVKIYHANINKYLSINQMFIKNIIQKHDYYFVKNQFNKQIERLMNEGKITDTYDIISRFILDKSFYDDAVAFLTLHNKSETKPYIYDKYKYANIFKLILYSQSQIFN